MAIGAIAAGALALCLTSFGSQDAPLSAQITFDHEARTFSLEWTHSIEKTQWFEHWEVVAAPQPHLRLLRARIEASGAGMEIPDNAIFRNGGYEYPVNQDLPSVTLSHSPFTAQAELCVGKRCRPLADWLPDLPSIQAVTLSACHAP
jgi:hypothetical protein